MRQFFGYKFLVLVRSQTISIRKHERPVSVIRACLRSYRLQRGEKRIDIIANISDLLRIYLLFLG
jgi:hypothetical protein